MPKAERLPSYGSLFKPAQSAFPYRRRCHKCGQHKPMTGGKTYPGGRVWRCAECR